VPFYRWPNVLLGSRWTRVTSSILEAVACDPAGNQLWIRFRSGAIYEYGFVPPVVSEELLAAPSPSEYFSEYILPDYPYRRVRGARERVLIPARRSAGRRRFNAPPSM
jgi:hypothetical protein